MKSLLPSLFSKQSPLALLDMAYFVVLLPLLLILKIPMLLFVLLVAFLLLKSSKPIGNKGLFILFVFGVIALYLSLYGAFSFSGLSRLKIFLELLVYVLLIVVSLQRLTRHINLYLIISPFLFLALSLFFFHGMIMLVYVIFEIFFLLWMILAHRMDGNLTESFRSATLMFLYSLPWVVILFIFFPRISFEHADYGFKGEISKRMGHDGMMHLDEKAFTVPSERIVMEVGFEKKVPHAKDLYFRGSTLYLNKGTLWAPLPPDETNTSKKYQLPQDAKPIHYKVTLYPTGKKWLYLLDMPMQAVKESHLDSDLISRYKEEIQKPLHYEASSALTSNFRQKLTKTVQMASLLYEKSTNHLAQKKAKEIRDNYPAAQQRADALLAFFSTQQLTYSLHPKGLDTTQQVDSFLFQKRIGYCVHFASSFVTMSRMLGIPARVVTGYKADKTNSLGTYLAVKEKDAHAWAELYINGAWHRYEPTATAAHIDAQSQTILGSRQKEHVQQPLLHTINLYLLYLKYQIETWILYYSHLRQLQLLEYAKENPRFLFGFVMGLVILIVTTMLLIAHLKRPRHKSKARQLLQPLLHRLHKEGYRKHESESMHQFFMRIIQDNPTYSNIQEIDKLYEQILYAPPSQTDRHKKLQEAIRLFLKTMKNP